MRLPIRSRSSPGSPRSPLRLPPTRWDTAIAELLSPALAVRTILPTVGNLKSTVPGENVLDVVGDGVAEEASRSKIVADVHVGGRPA